MVPAVFHDISLNLVFGVLGCMRLCLSHSIVDSDVLSLVRVRLFLLQSPNSKLAGKPACKADAWKFYKDITQPRYGGITTIHASAARTYPQQ